MVNWRQDPFLQIQQLIRQAQSLPVASPEWKCIINDLAERVLKKRRVFRLRGRALSTLAKSILDSTHELLIAQLEETLAKRPSPSSLRPEWILYQLETVFRGVLTESVLEQLALDAQKHQPRTAAWQQALTDLFKALELSGQLIRPSSLSRAEWQDAANQTFAWVSENLLSFDASRGPFIPWVNFRLKMIANTLSQEARDPLNRQIYGKITRSQYQLHQYLKKLALSILSLGPVKLSLASTWVWLYLKGSLPDSEMTWAILLRLMLLTELAAVLQHLGKARYQFLFETAQTLLSLPVGVVSTSMDLVLELKVPDQSTSWRDALYRCIKKDPCGIFSQPHIRNSPHATFQVICLARLDGEQWESLSNRLGINLSTLSTFFYRTSKRLSPQVCQCIEDEL